MGDPPPGLTIRGAIFGWGLDNLRTQLGEFRDNRGAALARGDPLFPLESHPPSLHRPLIGPPDSQICGSSNLDRADQVAGIDARCPIVHPKRSAQQNPWLTQAWIAWLVDGELCEEI
jgi:hypothetical protein